MTTMIKTYCQSCGTTCGDISIFDAPYSGEPTCWGCADKVDRKEFEAWAIDINSCYCTNNSICTICVKGY